MNVGVAYSSVVRRLRKIIRYGLFACLALMCVAAYVMYPPPSRAITLPGGKKFAFTIVDDTDLATVERSQPLYDVLHRYGLRTTKTVWVLETSEPSHSPNRGHTLRDLQYRAFIVDLQRKGFEIALHGVRGGTSMREDIATGLEEFKRELGSYPRLHVNHSFNKDNLYWGSHRWSFPPLRWAYAGVSGNDFFGDDPRSVHFWGDFAKQHVQYVNQFTFTDINLLNVTPSIPYHLSEKPYVNYWFPTADGDNLDIFEDLLKHENLDRLEREGGICLVYTHLGAGSFNKEGGVNPRFEARIKDVSSRNGWFVPASEILDYLREQPGWVAEPSVREKIRLEILFLWTAVKLRLVR